MTDVPLPVLHTLSGAHSPDEPPVGPIRLSVHEAGAPSERPPVVLCHGFPDLAYGWRHQLPALAEAGFRAIAPDQRGYGGSSAPEPIGAYSLDHLCGDLADLLDAMEIERAVFVGHDWGGFVAWAMPLLHPDRCAGVVGVCTPYTPFPGTDLLRSMFGEDPEAMYMLWFQEPGVAEAVLDPRARLVFDKLTIAGVDPEVLAEAGTARRAGARFNPFLDLESMPDLGEKLLSAEELDHYATVFERTGFRGGINWYRNIDANGAAHPEVGTTPLTLPTLMLCAEWDPALPPALAANMGSLCSDLELHTISRAGHWVNTECPDQVNELLVDWLTRRFG
jgi:pimeloyl-ACP methyl ester carboxylesterase